MPDTSVSYKCPKCGAPLTFLPGHNHVTCAFCDAKISIAEMDALYAQKEEQAAQAAEKAEEKEAQWNTKNAGSAWDGAETANMMIQTCSSCGAELVSDGNTMATECAYCGSPNMIPSQFGGMLRPDYVIPFQKTKQDAIAALKEFYSEGLRKYILPTAFTSENRIKEIQSMYVPFWLFDAHISADANYLAERSSSRDTENETVTETSHYRCERSGEMTFHGIPVDASVRMDDSFMDSIEPFDYSELVPFSAAYFTGHIADKYDVDAEASVPRADKRVHESAVGVLEGTVTGYDRCSLDGEASVIKEDGTVSYAMAPVWILTTKYHEKPYTFMMNGQTGKVVGSVPIDRAKVLLYSIIPALVSIPVFYYLAKFVLSD